MLRAWPGLGLEGSRLQRKVRKVSNFNIVPLQTKMQGSLHHIPRNAELDSPSSETSRVAARFAHCSAFCPNKLAVELITCVLQERCQKGGQFATDKNLQTTLDTLYSESWESRALCKTLNANAQIFMSNEGPFLPPQHSYTRLRFGLLRQSGTQNQTTTELAATPELERPSVICRHLLSNYLSEDAE